MDLFKKLYQLGNKSAHDLMFQAGLITDKDANIFFVDSVHGSDSYGGQTFHRPLATIGAAYSKMTANNHDWMVLLPRHDETLTGVLTLAKAGINILGLKQGNLRPNIDINVAADCLSIEAANIRIQGIEFGAPGLDAVTADINVAGAYAVIEDCRFIGSTTAKNKVSIITLASGGDDCLIKNCRMYNATVELDGGFVDIGAAVSRLEIDHLFTFDSIGCALGAVFDGATALQIYIHDSVLTNAKAGTVVAEFGNNSTGVVENCFICGRHTTIASNVTPGTGMNFFNCKGVEEAAKNAISIPVDDAD